MKLFGVSLIGALIVQGFSFATAPVRASAVQEVALNNGLKVLLLEDHASPAVTFQVWYRVGSRNEIDGKSGLSHFLEHMMFKGTSNIAPDEHMKLIAKNGGRSNAFTTQDATVYFATVSRDKIGICIELEADRMVRARMDDEYFEVEKKVVMEERRLRTEDRPSAALAELTNAIAYTVHPYRRPVVGWMQDLENLTPEDLRSHYRTYYAPNNAFLVVVGDFSPAEVLSKIKTSFGTIPRKADPPRVVIKERPQRGERRGLLKKTAELPLVLMAYHVPNLLSPDSYALDLLPVVLARGRSSRLHRDLVYRRRLARDVEASYDGTAIDSTLLTVTAQAMPGKDPAELERAVDEVLDRIKSQPVTKHELQKAKNQVEAAFIFRQDSIFGQALRIGHYEIAGGWPLMNRYLNEIRKVTSADLMRVAQRYLQRERRTVGVLVPRGEP